RLARLARFVRLIRLVRLVWRRLLGLGRQAAVAFRIRRGMRQAGLVAIHQAVGLDVGRVFRRDDVGARTRAGAAGIAGFVGRPRRHIAAAVAAVAGAQVGLGAAGGLGRRRYVVSAGSWAHIGLLAFGLHALSGPAARR